MELAKMEAKRKSALADFFKVTPYLLHYQKKKKELNFINHCCFF